MLPVVQIVHREGILDLGWGHPDPALLPVDALRRAADATFARYGADALAYGAERGPGPLIEWIRARLALTDARSPAPDEMVIVAGASQALDLLCTLYTSPGDVVLVESPTYHLAVRILRDHPLALVPVASGAGGLDVDSLRETLDRLARAGKRPRMLYCVPTHHNPTGATMNLARRQALVEMALEAGLLLVEDDVYRELSYDAPTPPSLWSIAPAGVVARISSFSKSLAPGLRLGYLTADAALTRRIVGGGMLDSGGGVNPVTALMVAELCAAGDFEATIVRLRTAYRARRDALAAGLEKYLPPGCRFAVPGGGFFQWVTLPEPIDAKALLPLAEAAGVSYLPGATFYLANSVPHTLRLSFSLYSTEQLIEAARRLGVALQPLLPEAT